MHMGRPNGLPFFALSPLGESGLDTIMFSDLLRDDVFRLETQRLWLRWPRASDARALARIGGDPRVAEMTPSLPQPFTEQAAADWVFSSRRANAEGESIVLVLTLKSRPGEPIGIAGLHGTRPGVAALGFWLGRPAQGQGLMTEAVSALIDMAQRAAHLGEIRASTRSGDGASRRVLEKCGFVSQGDGLIDLPARGGVIVCERFHWLKPAEAAENAA
jgi:RimJ/RimL family protein N-acetyltransferase